MNVEFENLVINLFEDGAVDIQTYKFEDVELRDCIQFSNGMILHKFPFWS